MERLRPQVCRADGVRLVDDGGTPGVVSTDRHREAEGEDERDEAEQRRLEDPERLTQRLCVRPRRRPTTIPSTVVPSTMANRISPSSTLLSRKNIGHPFPRGHVPSP